MGNGKSAAILGCGVIGLTTALELLSAGWKVSIYAECIPPNTTSNVACALFLPLWINPGSDAVCLEGQVLGWSSASWLEFVKLEKLPEAGIRRIVNYELVADADEAKEISEFFSRYSRVIPLEAGEILAPDGKKALAFETLIIETPKYLKYFFDRVYAEGGRVSSRTLNSQVDISAIESDVVFNCLGLSSGSIFGDNNVFPVKGQLALIDWGGLPSVDFAIGDNDFCLIPRTDAMIIGSLYKTQFEMAQPDPREHVELMSRILGWAKIMPGRADLLDRIHRTQPRDYIAGLRPARIGGVRVEAEMVDGRLVVHNYGHGGGGVTLSWGTVRSALQLV